MPSPYQRRKVYNKKPGLLNRARCVNCQCTTASPKRITQVHHGPPCIASIRSTPTYATLKCTAAGITSRGAARPVYDGHLLDFARCDRRGEPAVRGQQLGRKCTVTVVAVRYADCQRHRKLRARLFPHLDVRARACGSALAVAHRPVGFCGAYTTFSSYSFETLKLLESGNYAAAAANFLANNLLALLAVLAGAMLARAVHYAS